MLAQPAVRIGPVDQMKKYGVIASASFWFA